MFNKGGVEWVRVKRWNVKGCQHGAGEGGEGEEGPGEATAEVGSLTPAGEDLHLGCWCMVFAHGQQGWDGMCYGRGNSAEEDEDGLCEVEIHC